MTTRRAFLAGLGLLLAAPLVRAGVAGARLAAAWQAGHGYQVGILELGEQVTLRAALDVPTRAHALLAEPGGTLLALARRPGDWLVRWDPDGRARQWRWIEPRRAFTGHLIRDGQRLYTCETDLDSGAGLIGVRDAATLEKLDEWSSHGIDPHQLVWDPAGHIIGHILVANGGVPTQAETGRMKRGLERMDSSLVRLHGQTGSLLGQWRLADRRLSLRHLAWQGEHLGIALQAEHDDPADKAAAPVLAVFDGDQLRPAPAVRELAGYGGDVAAVAGGFAVSCPRAQGIALFGVTGEDRGFVPLAEACSLAAADAGFRAGGRGVTLSRSGAREDIRAALPDIRLDNHWIALG